jgi:uncharacterized membrane protein YjfL (UPF0719 family)
VASDLYNAHRMSGDEVIVFAASALLAVVMWGAWYIGPRRIRRLGRPATGRSVLDLAPLVSLAVLVVVLKTVSAHDVRDDVRYLLLYFFLGAMWVSVAMRCLPLIGLSARDDVVERGNGSAARAISGAILAITLCFAGGNIGNGPGWWVVVFSAGLATVALLLSWLVLEAVAGVADVVTIDRDDAAGMRLGGWLIACGLIAGVAAAGDWESAEDTVRTFVRVAWPLLPFVAFAALLERQWRPTPERPSLSVTAYGAIPALLYIGIAALYVFESWPEA